MVVLSSPSKSLYLLVSYMLCAFASFLQEAPLLLVG